MTHFFLFQVLINGPEKLTNLPDAPNLFGFEGSNPSQVSAHLGDGLGQSQQSGQSPLSSYTTSPHQGGGMYGGGYPSGGMLPQQHSQMQSQTGSYQQQFGQQHMPFAQSGRDGDRGNHGGGYLGGDGYGSQQHGQAQQQMYQQQPHQIQQQSTPYYMQVYTMSISICVELI